VDKENFNIIGFKVYFTTMSLSETTGLWSLW